MKKLVIAIATAGFAVSLVSTALAEADLMITGVMDGDRPGGQPKMVELYARNDIADLSQYALSRAGNGSSSWDSIGENHVLPPISLKAGDFYYAVGNSFDDQTETFDAIWPAYSGIRMRNYGVNSNGDDVTGLFHDATGTFSGGETLIDVFGELGVDGSGTVWEHKDGWAYSNDGRKPSATFNVANWDVQNGALDGLDEAGHADSFPDMEYVAEVASSPPTITEIADQSIPADTTTGPLVFKVDDLQTAPADLVVTASSDNTSLVPNNDANLVLAGADNNRTIEVIPAASQEGTANITITVTDGDSESASTTFAVTVGAPFISPIANVVTPQDTATAAIPFEVGDNEQDAGSLVVTGTSSDPLLVPDANISVANLGGGDRAVTITPASFQVGTAEITLTVSDGVNSMPTMFHITVSFDLGLDLTDDFEYADGPLPDVSSFVWFAHSRADSNDLVVAEQKVSLSYTNNTDAHAFMFNTPYATNSGIVAYTGFVVSFSELPSFRGSYFAHFWDTGFNYPARVFAMTEGAEDGKFRLGVSNGGFPAEIYPLDLVTNAEYNVVTCYNLGTAETKLWINPTSEDDPSISATDVRLPANVDGYALRQASGIGTFTFDNLRISTTFNDVLTAVAPTPIPLNIEPEGQDVVLTWTNPAFTLQSAPAPDGEYTDVPDAASPYTVPASEDQQYYRLKY